MKFFTLPTGLALTISLPLIHAHTRFTTLSINSVDQGDGTCIRMDMNPSTTSAFVSGFDSPDMACGVDGAASVNRTCTARAGDSLALLHRAWADGQRPDLGSIDPSHLGTTAIYMKKMAGAESQDPWATSAAGDGWFRIFYDGYSDGSWGTQKLIADNGLLRATVPSDIEEGYYLVRSEVLGMQNVQDTQPATINPQFFIGCAQIYVEGGGSSVPADTVSIPGYVDASTPAFAYNIYKMFPPGQPFPDFGPETYVSSGAGSTGGDFSNTTALVGSCPTDTVLEIGNTCLTELTAWSNDTAGYLPNCWAASDACWAKHDTCWNNFSPAVDPNDQSKGCNLWGQKCWNLVDWCHAGNTYGPPDAGKVLTPAPGTLGKRGDGMSRMSRRRALKARARNARNMVVV